MAYFRITYSCEMRNTPKRQAELDEMRTKNNRYFYPLDAKKDYTESENVEAETRREAYVYGRDVAVKKTGKYFNQDGTLKDSVFGFTVKYSVDHSTAVLYIGESLVNDDKKTLHYSFAIDRMRVFEVNYYRCGNNGTMYFTTSAARFNRPKNDWEQCGQAQDYLLPAIGAARAFYKKWDDRHLKELGDAEYTELLEDLEELKRNYRYIKNQNFNDQKKLSMEIPRNYNATGGNAVKGKEPTA